MDAASPEFTRAWQLYFKQRGGIGPTLPGEVLPVVILDDNSRGPYPTYRPWVFGTGQGASAGNSSYVGVQNTDPVVVKSVVVIDRITVQLPVAVGPATRIGILIAPISLLALATSVAVDVDGQKEPEPNFTDPRLGNVTFGATLSASAFASAFHPAPPVAGTLTNIEGPWMLGPRWELLVTPDLQNTAVNVWMRGRYYGGA